MGNREYLFRRVAWRLQALAEGDLTERARRRAHELARDADLRRRAPRELALPAAEGELKTVTGEIATGSDERAISPGMMGAARDGRLPMPGQTLTRPYKGQVYEVRVLTNGFEYDGRAYRSLSAVAHAITGSHWNGYRFFGRLAPKQTAEKGDR